MAVDSSIIQRIPPLDRSEIKKHLDVLVSMGPRWPSSPAEHFAGTYIQEKMQRYVDEMLSEPFEYPLYVPIESGLQIISENGMECAALGVQFSANGEAEGELFYIEQGDSFQPEVSSLPGRILLTRTRRPYLIAKSSEASGARGIIVISESPPYTIRNMIAKTGYVQGMDPEKHRTSVPIIAVDALSGRYLQELCAKSGTRVRMVHRSLQIRRYSRNVVGRILGKTGRCVVVGAHYDTQINVPGAWDNAAGCALLLDMARAMREMSTVHDVELVAFGCEEAGIVGSSHYVTQRKSELKRISCYFNLDSVSSSTSKTLDVHSTPEMAGFVAALMENACTLKPTSYSTFGPDNIAQDSAPFFLNGVGSIWIHEEGNPCFHTPLDTPEKVDIDRLAKVGGAIWTMSAYLAAGGTAA
jgi:aminopeptidase YwaD